MTEVAPPSAAQIDPSVPHSARIWNYWLGGKDNYPVDREADDKYRELYPQVADTLRAARYFMARVVRYLAGEAGIRQFRDVGAGLPTADNTHEVAQRVAPECRIVYVGNNPHVLAHARVLLTSSPAGACDHINADMRDPAGSYLTLADTVSIGRAHREAAQRYAQTGTVLYQLRGPEQIKGFFAGLTLIDPGAVPLPDWRPDPSPSRQRWPARSPESDGRRPDKPRVRRATRPEGGRLTGLQGAVLERRAWLDSLGIKEATMSGPPKASTLLDLLEPGWRRHLASGEPAGTLDVEPELLDAAALALGNLSRSEPPGVLNRRWPACIVVAVAQVTACYDKNGKVWPAWFLATRTRATKRSAADWAQAFLGSLATLGVPGLAGDPLETVLAHAAVPASCLPEFLRLAGAGAPEAELSELDPALAGLLRLEAGTGFVGRCRRLMELLTEPGESGAEDLVSLSLPHRIVDAARTVAVARPGPGRRRPLRLDPFGRGVLARDADRGADQGQDDARSWTATSPAEVTEPADPLLAFDADGEPVLMVLPSEAVWLVYPEDRALRADSTPRVLVESRLPLTWNGWRLVQLDLAGVAWLELEPAGGAAPRRRPVRGRTKPRLVTGAPVPGVHTPDGLPVFGTLPMVRLPSGETWWQVEVRRPGSGPILGRVEVSGDRWDPERLWDRASRPVLGELVVTVTALDTPQATGLRRVVAVAEGLDVSYSPALRLTATEGLEPAEAVFSPAPGMTASPQAAMIPAEVTGVAVTCVAGLVVLPLWVTPPHCRVRIEPEPGSGDGPTAWHSLGPLPLQIADLSRGGALRLDLPGAVGDPPVDVVATGGTAQVLTASKQGRYPLRRMLDTVSAHGGAELRITIGVRTAVIARISASAPADDPWLSG